MMTHVVLVAGELGDIRTLGANLKGILIDVIVPLMGVAFVAWSWFKSKSAVTALVACLAAGAVWWGVSNLATLRDKTGEDLNPSASSQSAVEHVVARLPGESAGRDEQ
ncbi:hypothetical protein ABZY02_35365 [Streptomyces sp. NPDC006649]|uniref:hypothetical protein n=1 Tax=Streptomyces sp. NPDC006649 TaxID=3156896 RepID=UPI0033BCD465